MRELMLKKKTGSTYDPTKANRAGQRMGQRKAGGMIKKKMASGGKVRGDGICKRGKTKGRMV